MQQYSGAPHVSENVLFVAMGKVKNKYRCHMSLSLALSVMTQMFALWNTRKRTDEFCELIRVSLNKCYVMRDERYHYAALIGFFFARLRTINAKKVPQKYRHTARRRRRVRRGRQFELEV